MKKMKTNSQKKKAGLWIALSFLIIASLSGTFAWTKYNDERINRFKTEALADGTVSIWENFTPVDTWPAGTDQTKEVAVQNTGKQDVFVRLSYEEVLEIYSNGGAHKETATPTVDNPSAATEVIYPVEYSVGVISGPEWSTISTANIQMADGSTIPGNLVVKRAESVSQGKVTGQYAMYYVYQDAGVEKYQKVSGTVKGLAVTEANSATSTYELSDVKYFTYHGRERIAKDWADNKNTLFGKSGTAYGVPYDYTELNPAVVPSDDVNFPAAMPTLTEGNVIGNIQADYAMDNGKMITIDYNTAAIASDMDPATASKGKWFYNKADGFFYYVGKLTSGTTTAQLMKKLNLSGDAGDAYSGIRFDLNVELNAIANIKEAITEEWGYKAGDMVYDMLSKEAAF